MEFRCFSSLDQLGPGADTLFSAAERRSVFFSRPWFETQLNRAVEDPSTLMLACVVDAHRVLALLPLLGGTSTGAASLSNFYTVLFPVLVDGPQREAALRCLAQGLRALPLHSLRLEPVAEDDPDVLALQAAMETAGFSTHRSFKFYNWLHRLDGRDYAAYLAERPGRVRSTIARKGRRLEREHGYSIRLFTDADVQQGMADYRAGYSASWKANEPVVGFLDDLAKRFAARGWLRLAILYVEDQPVAGQLWFVAHGRASIYRLAYDEDWKVYSPGSILTDYLMRQVIDVDQVTEIDFGIGNERYKQDWMTARRERWSLSFDRPTERGGRSKLRRLWSALRAGRDA